nr:immunoglobulin light chain junction region [Macaca mulatta]MOX77651.1 immunoglobulin light chain junction region [Macaca mulatta]MOX77679.1 immunoglobulin light chain junction region [Macaca mulatta]MOX77748.1 immunoglobulin light chain junction region [Macaca mulatta]MOX77882.1 immunoglobulin light chain junction region [Macaca mulatta]
DYYCAIWHSSAYASF